MSAPTSAPAAEEPVVKTAPIPRTFLEYLRAMGPGIVVVLTWLGAGDIVDASVAGGSYGYALMWVLALALVIRWLFVSIIAKYQLCNQHGESVMDGLKRLHPLFPAFILAATVTVSHIVGVYMYQGLGESCAALAQRLGEVFGVRTSGGPPWLWALGWGVAFFLLVSRPVFRRIEWVFLLFLGLLSVSLLGAAAWSGPDFVGILRGTVGFQLPPRQGAFHAELVAVSLVGAVAGSLANLMYPYFIREKGWLTPAHRKVQFYDLALGVAVLIVLDLAVWILGAEVLHPAGSRVDTLPGIAGILTLTLGYWGGVLFYLGVFAAVGSSVVGNALAYSYMATDAYLVWRRPARTGDETSAAHGLAHAEYRRHPGYRLMTIWCLFSPLVWTFTGKANFVAFTVAANAFQVLLLPVLAIAIWILTSGRRYIGAKYANRPWENVAMALFCAAALLGAAGAGRSLLAAIRGG
jgi:Mn2+/Fe2+ NRAMP family transporter